MSGHGRWFDNMVREEAEDASYREGLHAERRLAALAVEYQAWCTREGLPQRSADEQDIETMTPEQRAYNAAFIRRWEDAA